MTLGGERRVAERDFVPRLSTMRLLTIVAWSACVSYAVEKYHADARIPYLAFAPMRVPLDILWMCWFFVTARRCTDRSVWWCVMLGASIIPALCAFAIYAHPPSNTPALTQVVNYISISSNWFARIGDANWHLVDLGVAIETRCVQSLLRSGLVCPACLAAFLAQSRCMVRKSVCTTGGGNSLIPAMAAFWAGVRRGCWLRYRNSTSPEPML